MKATIDIPDDLYRRAKARSALEGRPFRSVAVELLQAWLKGPLPGSPSDGERREEASAPWLAITRKARKPGMTHDLESIRAAIGAGWSAEVASKTRAPAKRRSP
jgi:hypothetical protein